MVNLQFLSRCFRETLSENQESRRHPKPPIVDELIRHAAAVNFKNHLRSRWLPDDESDFSPMVDSEKQAIKTLIVSLMDSYFPSGIQSELIESLSIIGKHDFLESWPSFLPDLISRLQKAELVVDYTSVNAILGLANSIFEKFRCQLINDDLRLDFEYCRDKFATPLLELFQNTDTLIDNALRYSLPTEILIESQTLCCNIFYSFYSEYLPDSFGDHMEIWMTAFSKYLVSQYGTVDEFDISDELRSAVLSNINCLVEKHEEAFHNFLNGFAVTISTLLEAVSNSPSRDQVATKALKFFTTVSTSGHRGLYAGENVIRALCLRIVIPMVFWRAEDEDFFVMDYIEFIRRDMEGSGFDTRRRMASELLKGLAKNYRTQVMDVLIPELQRFCSSFSANPAAQWKDKACAIELVVSLVHLSAILPELHSLEVNSFPMLKAGCLKFLMVFPSHIPSTFPKPIAIPLVMDLTRFLQAESKVLHSYAAISIENLLLVKDERVKRYVSGVRSLVLVDLMTSMFDALKLTTSEENQYIMRCIMRVLGLAEFSSEVAGCCFAGLTSLLSKSLEYPKNSAYNHGLFESIAVLVRRASEGDVSLISAFEMSLFPSLKIILDNDITEFLPYAFQLLSQLLELNTPLLSPQINKIFSLRLSTDQDDGLNRVLGLFEKLVSSPRTHEQVLGFDFLLTFFEEVDFSKIDMKRVWSHLSQCLQDNTTAKFQNYMLVFMSNLVMVTGPSYIKSTMNQVNPSFFTEAMEEFWIPGMQQIKKIGEDELKAHVGAASKLLFDISLLQETAISTGTYGIIWFNILAVLARLLTEELFDP
ncbi:hypothetical protein EUTSA_v10019782mg, partial [Eutrema salsugineum]